LYQLAEPQDVFNLCPVYRRMFLLQFTRFPNAARAEPDRGITRALAWTQA
jgi:hypothetical protein